MTTKKARRRSPRRSPFTKAQRAARARKWEVCDAANHAYKALLNSDHPGTPDEVAALAFKYGEAWADEVERRYPTKDD